MRRVWLPWLVLSAGCFETRAYQCERAEQCALEPGGSCEPTQWCAYPKDDCPSARAYGPHAPPAIAGTCVPTEDEGSSSESSGGESSSGGDGGIPVLCGNGVLDPGESCDHGGSPDGTCHPLCVEVGTPAWTRTYDGEFHGDDRGFGVVVDAAADAIYVAGLAAVNGPDRDILVQRWRLATGELLWTETLDGGALTDDMGEHLDLDAKGNIIVGGVVTRPGEDEVAWLAKYDPNGNQLWVEDDADSPGDKIAGVAVAPDGRIIAAGRSAVLGYDQAWMQWYSADGTPDGMPLYRGDIDFSEATDVIVDGDGFQVTGWVTLAGAESQVWTARYDNTNAMVWEHVQDGLGNVARGVGQAFDPMGGSAIAGVVNNDVLVTRFDAEGGVTQTLTEAGPREMHDEAADVAFLPDGRFVVVGFLDFATTGFATSDSWVRAYSPSGEALWTDRFQGGAEEIDKALGVSLTENSAVVVGYETIPGQSRDVWLRRYAL